MFSIISKRLFNSFHSLSPIVNVSGSRGTVFKPVFVMSKKKVSEKKTFVPNLSAKVQVSILGNGALGNPASVIVNTDLDTYLINCGEGVQRLFYQHRIRISKIKDVFLTRVAHSNYAGIFGMFLTYDSYFNERGCVPVLYTPPGMKAISSIYSPFIGLVKNFQYRLIGDEPSNIQTEDGDEIENEKDSKVEARKITSQCETLVENVDMTIKSVPILSAKQDDTSIAYIFLVSDKPGQLLIEKCKKLKIPPGPLFSKLKSGQEIEVNGQKIRPNDVLGPTELGTAFVILECPTTDSIESLMENGTFREHLQNKSLRFIIHITPEGVFQTEQYQKWIQSFEAEVKHFVLNATNSCEMSLNDSSYVQAKLNRIDTEIFPFLKENHAKEIDLDQRIIKDIPTMFTFNLRPEKLERFQFAQENCSFEIESVVESLKDIEHFEEQIQEYRSSFTDQKNPEEFEQNILFLGTGSSIPGKLRNTSAIFLNIRDDSTAILDCGEATFMQLCRFYGRDRYQQMLKSISFIFVSHLHADHHFGMLRILQEISRISTENKTILVIAPQEIYNFLQNFTLDRLLIDFLPTNSFVPEIVNSDSYSEFLESKFYKLQKQIGIEKIVTVPVPHSYQSHGIVIDLGEGKRIAYSGDSQFSNTFDVEAKDCLVMIHEATMDDDLRMEADTKRHSTISDAISVARNCNSQYTILTHFSQRYAKIPLVNSQSDDELNRYICDNVGIAFDFMNIKLSQLAKAGKLKIPLETLFANDLQDIHDKQAKKALKRKLLEDEVKILLDDAKNSVSNSG